MSKHSARWIVVLHEIIWHFCLQGDLSRRTNIPVCYVIRSSLIVLMKLCHNLIHDLILVIFTLSSIQRLWSCGKTLGINSFRIVVFRIRGYNWCHILFSVTLLHTVNIHESHSNLLIENQCFVTLYNWCDEFFELHFESLLYAKLFLLFHLFRDCLLNILLILQKSNAWKFWAFIWFCEAQDQIEQKHVHVHCKNVLNCRKQFVYQYYYQEIASLVFTNVILQVFIFVIIFYKRRTIGDYQEYCKEYQVPEIYPYKFLIWECILYRLDCLWYPG